MSNRRNRAKRRNLHALHSSFFAMQNVLYVQKLTAYAHKKGYALVLEQGTFHFVKVLIEKDEGDESCQASKQSF